MHEMLFYIFPNKNFVDLNLYQFGREKCVPGHSFGPAKRTHYLFHYIIRGKGLLYSTDETGNTHIHHLEQGQGFMIFPEQLNTYIADENEPWEYTWVEFDGLRVKEALEIAGFSINNPIYKARDKNLSEKMKSEMLYMVDNHSEVPFHLIGHLYLFVDYLYRSMTRETALGTNKLRDYYIKEATAYLENHFQEDVTVEDIADSIGLNRSYFGKIFKQETGKSPQSFIINYRMIKATELLRLTDMTVNEIARSVGYPNQMNFSRTFKKVFDVSPSQWRRANKSTFIKEINT